MYSRLINWFDARSQGSKLALVFSALLAPVLLLLLSPLLMVLAVVMLGVSLIMVLVRRRNGGPMKNWGIAAGASLLLVFGFGGVSDVLYGGTPTEQAAKDSQETSTEQTTEEPKSLAQGDTHKSSVAEENESKGQEKDGDDSDQAAVAQDSKEGANAPIKANRRPPLPPSPQPETVEDRITSTVKKASYLPVRITTIPRAGTGCYNVSVNFNENPMDEIEWLMEDIYAGLYKDPQLAGKLCNTRINAFGDIREAGSRKWHKEKVYSTTLTATAAESANWKKDYGVSTYSANNLKKVWKTNFIHPAIRQAKKQEQAKDRLKRELDCAYDEGIFDVDALCP